MMMGAVSEIISSGRCVTDSQFQSADSVTLTSSLPRVECQGQSDRAECQEQSDPSTQFNSEVTTRLNKEPVSIPSAISKLPQHRLRSSIACRKCHHRRVKCDASTRGLPCSNCETAAEDCQFIESKRGRKRGSRLKDLKQQVQQNEAAQNHPRSATALCIRSPRLLPLVEETTWVSPRLADTSKDQYGRHSRSELPTGYGRVTDGPPVGTIESVREDDSNRVQREDGKDGSEMLYARMLDNTMDTSKHRSLIRPARKIIYLGETFNLTYVLHQYSSSCPPGKHSHKLHYPLPENLDEKARDLPKDIDNVTVAFLHRQDAFTIPPLHVCKELYRTYFTYVHPHYPIIDRKDFSVRYADPSNPPSYLLMQAVFFMASGHCDESILQEAGFDSRCDARLKLYKRAKALYDSDHESDKVVIVQSLFLMSFWWASPTDQKDTWHWLGCSISLAQTLGMHRSTRDSDMSLRDKRLWKRVWWSLFVSHFSFLTFFVRFAYIVKFQTEDKHASAALGRPMHIRLDEYDVERLEEDDFEDDSSENPSVFGSQNRVHVLYVIHLTKLAEIRKFTIFF